MRETPRLAALPSPAGSLDPVQGALTAALGRAPTPGECLVLQDTLGVHADRAAVIYAGIRQAAADPQPRLVLHNLKVWGLLWDLPVGSTCRQVCAYCYARKAEWRDTVLRARVRRLVQSFRDDFAGRLSREVARHHARFPVRFHSSGDVYSQAYWDKLLAVARQHPERPFWMYTQRQDLLGPGDLAGHPENLTVIFSLHGVRRQRPEPAEVQAALATGYDKVAWVADGPHVQGSCPAIGDPTHRIKCGRDCFQCLDRTTRVVSFTLH